MTAQQPVPADAPVMIAWKAYQASEDYENTKGWAVKPEHTEGSLWAAFEESFREARRFMLEELKSSEAEVEMLRQNVISVRDRYSQELAALRSSSLTPRQAFALRYVCEDYQDGITPEDLSPEEIKDTLEKLRFISGGALKEGATQ